MEQVEQIIASSDPGNVVINDENGIYNGITNQSNQFIGDKRYELANHLGNVLEVITDRKVAVDFTNYDPNTGTYTSTLADGSLDYYTADVISQNDYSPFGMLLPNRHESSNEYRYGFNGMEKDDEITGVEGSHLDFGARIYDPRISRWLSMDPAGNLTPHESPYIFAGCNPIFFVDPNGKWKVRFRDYNDHSSGVVFEAEPGDNLQTLADQMGIPYQQLVDDNFGGNDFTKGNPLNGGEWLRQEDLPGVDVLANVNNYLANENVELTNCANCAMSANGLETINAWEDEDGSFNKNSSNSVTSMDQTEDYLEKYFEPVSAEKSQIGDVITYRVKPEYAQEARAWAYDAYGASIFDADGQYTEDYWTLVQDKINSSDADHYSIVLLKTKDGQNVQTIFEKPGTNPATYSPYKSSETFDESPANNSGGKSVIHTKK